MKLKVKVEAHGKENFLKFLENVRSEFKDSAKEATDTLKRAFKNPELVLDETPKIKPYFQYVFNQYLEAINEESVVFSASGLQFGLAWGNVATLDSKTSDTGPKNVVYTAMAGEIRSLDYSLQRPVPYWRALEFGQYVEAFGLMSLDIPTQATFVWHKTIGDIISGPAAGKPLTFFSFSPFMGGKPSVVPAYPLLRSSWAMAAKRMKEKFAAILRTKAAEKR
jgi:hypothetical protein